MKRDSGARSRKRKVIMGDIGTWDDADRQEVLLRLRLEIRRMETNIEELKFKIFQNEKQKKSLLKSCDENAAALESKREELADREKEFSGRVSD